MHDRYLFKAKRKDNGELVFGGLSYCDKTGAYFITNMGKDHISYIGFHQEVDSNTICQCTGLKDKNGRVIWENDILSGHIDVDIPEDETRKRVVWYENGWCTNEPGCDYYEALDDFDSENFEVIGNMIDNLEMLDG